MLGVAIAGVFGIGVFLPSLAVGFICYLAARNFARVLYDEAKSIL
jgi:hypothetical protein